MTSEMHYITCLNSRTELVENIDGMLGGGGGGDIASLQGVMKREVTTLLGIKPHSLCL
jgi:hypothetical protein